MSQGLVLLFAVTTGLVVANLYYSQPLLHLIAADFRSGAGATGVLVTVTQIGYAAGLLFAVPAGDLFVPRRYVPCLLLVSAAALLGAALAPSLPALMAAAAIAGFCSVAAQVLVPLAAAMSSNAQRARVIGTVFSGLLLGILLARTIAGLLAEAVGWRGLYGIAAALMLGLAVLLSRVLPAARISAAESYASVLRSTVALARDLRELRHRSLYGAAGFAAFSVFWTTAAFLLSGAPYHYGTITVGLFGLVGAAGALSASWAGRLLSRCSLRWLTGAALALTAASFALLWVGRDSLAVLVLGIIVLDIGVQGLHVLNQNTIYSLAPGARSRINGVYMTLYFVGGAVGSAAASLAWSTRGWAAVCVAGAALPVAVLCMWAWWSRSSANRTLPS
ncbi:MAG TPA: MFS transporter [Streptosporangiaceae bacterium]